MILKTVFRALNSAEAQLIRSQLEAANFNVFVADETSALSMEGYVLGAGGIRIQVPDGEGKDASEFLKSCGYPVE